jgi:hypothetical protein
MIDTRLCVMLIAGLSCVVSSATEPGVADSDAAAHAATAQAIATLARQRGMEASAIQIVRAEPMTWNDSSMGCARPGTTALQVITPGYRVILSAAGHEFPVHVAQGRSVVCDRSVKAEDLRRALRVSGIEKAMQLAREDLATRLSIDVSTIRVSNVHPAAWSDSALGCPRSNESVTTGSYRGFTMDLKFKGRAFAYRADATQARACPPIESE